VSVSGRPGRGGQRAAAVLGGPLNRPPGQDRGTLFQWGPVRPGGFSQPTCRVGRGHGSRRRTLTTKRLGTILNDSGKKSAAGFAGPEQPQSVAGCFGEAGDGAATNLPLAVLRGAVGGRGDRLQAFIRPRGPKRSPRVSPRRNLFEGGVGSGPYRRDERVGRGSANGPKQTGARGLAWRLWNGAPRDLHFLVERRGAGGPGPLLPVGAEAGAKLVTRLARLALSAGHYGVSWL